MHKTLFFGLALILFGCDSNDGGSGSETEQTGTESDSTESETETDGETSCAAVSGKKFVMESTDCGPVPGSTCTWYVDFDLEGGFDYTLSDYNISGTYSCDGNTVTGEHNNGSYTGIVDEDAGTLMMWDDRTFTLE